MNGRAFEPVGTLIACFKVNYVFQRVKYDLKCVYMFQNIYNTSARPKGPSKENFSYALLLNLLYYKSSIHVRGR